MGEHSAGFTLVIIGMIWGLKNDSCNINKQMKLDLTLIHSVTWTSTAPIAEYFNRHDTFFVYTVLICSKMHKANFITN